VTPLSGRYRACRLPAAKAAREPGTLVTKEAGQTVPLTVGRPSTQCGAKGVPESRDFVRASDGRKASQDATSPGPAEPARL
jgi:hypothetical protein